MLLEVSRLSKRFGQATVLRDVSFTVRENEILGLIGPNGAGKTTLFECLAGLLPADSGAPRAGKGELFYLPDGIRPWRAQTVRWALRFFESGFGNRGAAQGGGDLVRALELEPYLDARIGSLSKGESKRLLLALGLLTPHPLLLLDEPFDGLDFRQTREVMALLRSVKGRTLFLSIHQLRDAEKVCDRLVLLSKGQVAGEGTLEELRQRAGLREGGIEEVFLALL